VVADITDPSSLFLGLAGRCRKSNCVVVVFPLFGNNNSPGSVRPLTEFDFLGGVIERTLLGGGRTATCSVQGSCIDGLSVAVHFFSFIASPCLVGLFAAE
jgi:hypothetical protein